MKRIISSFVATVVGLIALLSFKTHTPEIDTAAATSVDDGSSVDLSSSVAPSTSTTAAPSVTSSPRGTTSSTSSPSTSSAQKSTSTTTTTKAPSKITSTTSITGSEVETRWGPVQVKITVKGSKVTAIDVVEYPSENPRDVAINTGAIPQLVSQALKAQSADIAGVSGATVTTVGFKSSLQSALSKI